MKKRKTQPRVRTVMRKIANSEGKLGRAREKLAQLSPGGTAERPIELESVAQIEPRAESFACLRCEGPLRCVDHVVREQNDELLRVAKVACRRCGVEREYYFRIRPYLAN